MAQLTITIPDAQLTRVLDAFAAVYGYDPASGQTPAEFARARVRWFMREVVKTHEATLAAPAIDAAEARRRAVAAVERDLVLS